MSEGLGQAVLQAMQIKMKMPPLAFLNIAGVG